MGKFYIELYPKADLENEWTKNKHTPGAMPCMRCGGPMRESLAENALSRALNVYVCPACGMDEALQDAARKVLPILPCIFLVVHSSKRSICQNLCNHFILCRCG